MRQFCDLLPKHGFALVGPVFDAVLAVPERQLSDGDDQTSRGLALLADFESLTGITMQESLGHCPACSHSPTDSG